MNDLPLIDTPPFHRPIEPHEIALVVKPNAEPMPPTALEIGAGWALSFFSFSKQQGRAATWGWVKGAFAVDEAFFQFDMVERHVYAARLIYLPNGCRIAVFDTAEDATDAAAILSRELDWSDQSLQALQAQEKRALAALQSHFDERDDTHPLRVWRARFDDELARAHG
ncbi:hypothetical protein [Methylosinus sp. Sm6]|uniref:hypothetical protein n=1 Tax=Methylosinus sp. Sm6 TaxID=2866948 RepID=UPI001C98E9FA|nr:hypothetical protein [Methylosinus sp. Sm6]MBY6242809.1 hypothetical protein [Methylosinus sp. Sm6]